VLAAHPSVNIIMLAMTIKTTLFPLQIPGDDARTGQLDTATMTITTVNQAKYQGAYRLGPREMTPFTQEEIGAMDFESISFPAVDMCFKPEVCYLRVTVKIDQGEPCCIYFKRVD
jgi:hypothetical protein